MNRRLHRKLHRQPQGARRSGRRWWRQGRCWPALVGVLMGCVACRGGAGPLLPDQESAPADDPYGQFQRDMQPPEPLFDEVVVQGTQVRSQPSPPGIPLPAVNPLQIQSDLTIASSPSLQPLNDVLYQRFVARGYRGVVNINSVNTTTAIQLFCEPESRMQVLAIDRPLRPAEQQACRDRQPVAFPIGKDAVVVVVNRDDTFVKQVTVQSLAAILTREQWSDVNSDWPPEPIQRFWVGPQSATGELMAARVLQGRLETLTNSPNTQTYKYEQPMVQALSTTRYGVGLLSYATYQRFANTLRAVAINGVAAGPESAQQGTYALGRTLYLYADRQQLQQSPQVSAWLNFCLSQDEQVLAQTQLFPLSPADADRSRLTWLQTMGLNP